jgi:hypothetical protein
MLANYQLPTALGKLCVLVEPNIIDVSCRPKLEPRLRNIFLEKKIFLFLSFVIPRNGSDSTIKKSQKFCRFKNIFMTTRA